MVLKIKRRFCHYNPTNVEFITQKDLNPRERLQVTKNTTTLSCQWKGTCSSQSLDHQGTGTLDPPAVPDFTNYALSRVSIRKNNSEVLIKVNIVSISLFHSDPSLFLSLSLLIWFRRNVETRS